MKNNIVLRSNVAFTFQDITGLTVVNNLFDGSGGSWPVACWNSGNSLNCTFYHNSMVNSGSNRCGLFALPEGSANMPSLKLRNNILDGFQDISGADVTHSVYTMMAVGQKPVGPTDVMQINRALVFTDYAGYDYSLVAGSPAIDAGTDVGVTTDVNGDARPYGSAPDIGCYEWQGTGLGLPDKGNLEIGGLVIPSPVRALAGAIIIKRAIVQEAPEKVRLFTMIGRPVTDFSGLHTGFYLLKVVTKMQRIMVVE